MSARTQNTLYIVFIVVSLTIIISLSISYILIQESRDRQVHGYNGMPSSPECHSQTQPPADSEVQRLRINAISPL